MSWLGPEHMVLPAQPEITKRPKSDAAAVATPVKARKQRAPTGINVGKVVIQRPPPRYRFGVVIRGKHSAPLAARPISMNPTPADRNARIELNPVPQVFV